MWKYSGVCSFRHVDCQKFLIRTIIKELQRLFSTVSLPYCRVYKHRIQMKNMFGRVALHSNHWQPHRNLCVRHVMHKPKNALKINMNQHVKINEYTSSSRDQICIMFIKENKSKFFIGGNLCQSFSVNRIIGFCWGGFVICLFVWLELPFVSFKGCFACYLNPEIITIWMQARHIENINQTIM